jgi:tRNA G18 (ribose-2'-O)-methylase SpoU
MRTVVVIAHNLRSSHNVGSLLRTAEGLGVARVYLTGYTPHPITPTDRRLPHIARKVDNAIHKTALGAEHAQDWIYEPEVGDVVRTLREQGYRIYALEQHPDSILLPTWKPDGMIALVLGREVEGVEPEVMAMSDAFLEIPMAGAKESYNVTQAAAMALYHAIHWHA